MLPVMVLIAVFHVLWFDQAGFVIVTTDSYKVHIHILKFWFSFNSRNDNIFAFALRR